MENKSTKKLKKILEEDLNNYANVGLTDDTKSKSAAIIGKEVSILDTSAKTEAEIERIKAQQDLERQKFEAELKFREREVAAKEKEAVVNVMRLDDERKYQVERLENEKKAQKRQFWINVAGVASTTVIAIASKVVYFVLARNAQKHDYEDYKIESSSSKEQRNNLLK